MTPIVTNDDMSIKERAAEWLFQQGVSTTLLILILIGVWVKSPDLLSKIQEGYDRNAAQLNSAAEKYVSDSQRQQQLILELLQKSHGDARRHNKDI